MFVFWENHKKRNIFHVNVNFRCYDFNQKLVVLLLAYISSLSFEFRSSETYGYETQRGYIRTSGLFNQGMLSKKYPLFANFIENTFSLFFKFNIRFFFNIFWDIRLKRILLCVSEGIKLEIKSCDFNSTVPEMEMDHFPQWISLS